MNTQEPESEDSADHKVYIIHIDDEDAANNEKREDRIKTVEWFARGFRLLAQYKGNRNMALDCFALAHGWGEMIGIETAVDISIKHFGDKSKKAAVTKCVKMFQDCLNIPPMPGQRGEKGRTKMAEARKSQLKTRK